MSGVQDIQNADIPLDKDRFTRSLLRHLTGALEDIIGLPEAAGFVSIVGDTMGEEIGTSYRQSLQVENLNKEQVAACLVDLKRRIGGEFYIIEESDEEIVFGNNACPFGQYVEGRPSLCMMTSNVFGRIAADNLGYANVRIDEAIANGDRGCRVVIRLKPDEGPQSTSREYFAVGASHDQH